MFTQCYSNLTEKKTKKRCSVLGVSYCFSLLNMENLWLSTSWERGGRECFFFLIPMSSSDGKRK